MGSLSRNGDGVRYRCSLAVQEASMNFQGMVKYGQGQSPKMLFCNLKTSVTIPDTPATAQTQAPAFCSFTMVPFLVW